MKQIISNSFICLYLLIVVIFLIDKSSTAGPAYNDADAWVQIFPQCGGQRQSPVSIDWINFGEIRADDQIYLVNYDTKPLSAKLLNNGHSIKVEFEWDGIGIPFIAGGVLDENEYVLDSMHFHWSRNSSKGSEHILFGHSGALEMHLVHYNRNYGSVKNALNFADGLAVIGGIFETDAQRQQRDIDYESDIPGVSQESSALRQIISHVDSVSTLGSSVDIEPFAINELRPIELEKYIFLSYLGSLTTPPCTENVVWLLNLYPYYISQEQLQVLQSAVELDYEDDHNNRPVQPMNGRTFTLLMGADATLV